MSDLNLLINVLIILDPIIVDTQIQMTSAQWNENGSILAVCGMKNSLNEKESNQVIFYSAYGVVSLILIIDLL